MSIRRSLPALLLLGAVAAGCTDLDVANPNQPSTGTFWRTSDDAVAGINATYNALQNNGTYGRWYVFVGDLRTDVGRVVSPWTDLSNFSKFTFASTDFEVNAEVWRHTYEAIFRANQVIANVPAIQGNTALTNRIVGEAKFLRGLLYYNLVNFYGGGIPLITAPSVPTDRPSPSTMTAVYAQIEKDLTEAIAALPASYSGADVGRATQGAARALLGKAQLQQRKWAEASATFAPLISSNQYDLIANYADNFTVNNENNRESVFEVQFGDRTYLPNGMRGLNIAKMVGPCGPGFCDGRPTRWLFDQFQASRTTSGGVDPRLNATIFYNAPGMVVYNRTFQERYPAGSANANEIFFKKYGDYYLAGTSEQDWDSGINFRVIRFADVLLSQAEALNEQGQTAAALPLVNRVRARAGLPALGATTQAAMRDAILLERALEFALEGQRHFDLLRQNRFDASAVARDPEFSTFAAGRQFLPIPQTEINLNPNIKQNTGYP
jgi:hypothetical protein